MSPATAPPQPQQASAKPAGTATAPAVAGTKSTPPPTAAAAPAVKVDAATQAAVEKKGGKLAGLKGMSSGALGKMKGVGKLPKKTLMIIGLVVVVVIAAVVVVAVSGGEKKPSGGGGIDIATLDDWSTELPVPPAQTLTEGDATTPNSVTFNIADLLGENATGIYFITNIEATLTWTDEPDRRWAGRTRVNQPDNFQLEINTTVNASAMSEVMGNDLNSKQGSISLGLAISSSDYTYVVVGNSTDMSLPPEASMGDVTVVVYLYEAEDMYASGPAAFKLNDTGNAFTLTISVKGKSYTPGSK